MAETIDARRERGRWFIDDMTGGGFFCYCVGKGFLNLDGTVDYSDRKPYKMQSREEAEFRLLLATEPRAALAPFLTATGGGYEGTCSHCSGIGKIRTSALWLPGLDDDYSWNPATRPIEAPCPTCSGTGGPPSRELLLVASDWYGDDWRADVLRQLSQGESK